MLECIVDHQSSDGARHEQYPVAINTSPPELELGPAPMETSRPLLRRAVSAPVETVENAMPVRPMVRRGSDTEISGIFNSLVSAAYEKDCFGEQNLRLVDAPEDDKESSLFSRLQHRNRRRSGDE